MHQIDSMLAILQQARNYFKQIIRIEYIVLYGKTLIISFLLMYILKCSLNFLLLTNFVAVSEFINPIEEDWYMKAYFDGINRQTKETLLGDSEISIINVKDSAFSRKNIAKVLQELRKIKPMPPAIVGIDIPFTDPYSDKDSNDSLIVALQAMVNDSIVVVCALTLDEKNDIKPPFFYDKVAGIHYGSAAHSSLDLLNYDTYLDGHVRFATKISELSIGKSLKDMERIIVNFRNKIVVVGEPVISDSFGIAGIRRMKELSNRIVLIGNEYDRTDQKFLPFVTTYHNQISGIRLLAYEICTLMAEAKGYDRQLYYPYKNSSFLLTFVLLICFSIAYFMFLLIINKLKSKFWASFAEPVSLIFVELVMYIVCVHVVTRVFMIIPNFAFLFGIIAFMGFSYRIADEIIFKRIVYKTVCKIKECKTRMSLLWKKG